MTAIGIEHSLERLNMQRLRMTLHGAVQGVGFRPFVYRLAGELRLRGWISNSVQGVVLEVEGGKDVLDQFLLRIVREHPPRAFIQSLEHSYLDPVGFEGFEIRESVATGARTSLVLPDIATCQECLDDIFDPDNRRHLYPFTNCTNCGPRFSIIEALPYDRVNTSMKVFPMCDDCWREYRDPTNRRFHAQPNACPVCGPHVEFWSSQGMRLSENLYALLDAVDAIRNGKIVAVKGIGGFHLMADAANEEAVERLRTRKRREEKPFALMYPSLERTLGDCSISDLESRLLLSPESPIVLLRRRDSNGDGGMDIGLSRLAGNVAPRNPYLGIMLPSTPLHHILLRELKTPVVATSGNVSDEPICTDEREALTRLKGIADRFLVHNRPIVRHVDDSIVRIVLGRELVLRRARGYAPMPIQITPRPVKPIVAVGAHLKNTIAVSNESNVFISQHIGDLETAQSYEAFQRAVADFRTLYDIGEATIVCDMHPEYLSTKFAHRCAGNPQEIQHHIAHIASCMAENQIEGPVLGVSWDGTGYGPDKTVWGGEFIVVTDSVYKRKATFRPFRLPGGDVAVREPRRSALGVLFELFGVEAFTKTQLATIQAFAPTEVGVLKQMLLGGLNSPKTSSVGRLFDAVASLMGIQHVTRFEGQAAMELEYLTAQSKTKEGYPFSVGQSPDDPTVLLIDWKQMIASVIGDVERTMSQSIIATKFHNTLTDIVVQLAERIGLERVVLSGGCFQNAYLLEHCVHGLMEHGLRPYWHQRVPPNDGGIALGQVYAAAHLVGTNKNGEYTGSVVAESAP